MKKRTRFLAYTAAVLLVAAAGPAAAEVHDVSIEGFTFVPAELTIAAGDTVRWTNNDGVTHTATANNGEFDSGNIPAGGEYMVRLEAGGDHAYFCEIHPSMTGTLTITTSDVEERPASPDESLLHSAFPNPFNGSATISFTLPAASQVTLEVYDVLGRQVRTLVQQRLSAGTHSAPFRPEGLASGAYYYRLSAGKLQASGTLLHVQ